ncbi:hypothetical protein SODG_000543 [Sodalis praecaptivus]
MTTTLVFRNTVLETISLDGQLWLTSAELAKALEYSISKSVTDLFNKNADEFSPVCLRSSNQRPWENLETRPAFSLYAALISLLCFLVLL